MFRNETVEKITGQIKLVMIVNGFVMEQLIDVYSRLFAQIAHQSDISAPTCHGNTQQDPQILLQKVNSTLKVVYRYLPIDTHG